MNRKTLVAAMAFALSLSAPLAFAQDEAATDPAQDAMAAEQAQPTTDPAAQTDDSTAAMQSDPAATTPAAPAAPAEQATDNRVTWSDLDADSNGSLTKEEAASVPALSQVFDDADADKDGALTPDEYKAFVASNQAEAAAEPGSEG